MMQTIITNKIRVYWPENYLNSGIAQYCKKHLICKDFNENNLS